MPTVWRGIEKCPAQRLACANESSVGSGRQAALEMKADLVLVCLVIAWCASPSTAGAQTPAPPDQLEKHAPADGAKAYSCVDPSDVLARRWFQNEPCRWPMYRLPAAVAPSYSEPLPLPKYPQPPAERKQDMPCSGGSPCSLRARTRLPDTVSVDPGQRGGRHLSSGGKPRDPTAPSLGGRYRV